jgi:hypothetical protein
VLLLSLGSGSHERQKQARDERQEASAEWRSKEGRKYSKGQERSKSNQAADQGGRQQHDHGSPTIPHSFFTWHWLRTI